MCTDLSTNIDINIDNSNQALVFLRFNIGVQRYCKNPTLEIESQKKHKNGQKFPVVPKFCYFCIFITINNMAKGTTNSADLLYAVNDRPVLKDAIVAAIQHLFAVLVAIVTPALIVSSALNLDIQQKNTLVATSLIMSGVATFVQCKRFGRIGCGLLCVQGTSFSFIGPIIAIGQIGGLPAVFGAIIAGAPVEMLVSVSFRYLRKIITPLVSGVVITLIGLCLIKVGILSCGGGSMSDANFASMQNLGVAFLVFVCVIIFNSSHNRYLRMCSILMGIVIGYVVAFLLGMVDVSALSTTGSYHFTVPIPFREGVQFSFSSFLAIAIVFLVTAIEATGDVTANSMLSGLPIEGDDYMKRVSGGVMADGFCSMISGMFGGFPNSIFAQNNGIIQLTGVASRYVGYFIALMLVLLGFFPGISMIFTLMPSPVLGGATLLMFGSVAAAGIRILSSQELDRSAILIIAASLSLGIGVEMVPDILSKMPESVRTVFGSGITTGGITAILSNILFQAVKALKQKK